MAISFDTATGSNNSGASILTYSHTCTGSNLMLFVGIWNEDGDTNTGVTYNGVSMTLVGKHINQGSTWFQYLYYLVSPTTGAHNVVISRSTSSGRLRGDSSSYAGVTVPSIDASNTGGSTSSPLTISLTTVLNNCWTVIAASNGQAVSAGSGTTARNGFSGVGGVLSGIGDSNGPITPAGSTSMGVTSTGTENLGGVMASFGSDPGNRYWVGGTGNWDNSSTTNWAYISGGTSGAPVPVASNSVFFDGNSGTGIVTLTTSPSVSSVTMTSYGGTLALSTFTLTLGGTGTIWTGGGTINGGTGTIQITDVSSSGKTFAGGGLTYANEIIVSGSSGTYTISGNNTFNNFYFTGNGTGSLTISGSNTFNDFKIDTPPHTVNFGAGTIQTLNTFTVSGTAGNLVTLQSTSSGSLWYLHKSSPGVVSCDYLSLHDSSVN